MSSDTVRMPSSWPSKILFRDRLGLLLAGAALSLALQSGDARASAALPVDTDPGQPIGSALSKVDAMHVGVAVAPDRPVAITDLDAVSGWRLEPEGSGAPDISNDLLDVKPRSFPISAIPATAMPETEDAIFLVAPSCPNCSDNYGPGVPPGWADHVPGEQTGYGGFGRQFGTVTTETLVAAGYFLAISAHKFFKDTRPFHFKDEGWFGKDTANIGVDKLTHAYDTYLLAELLHERIHNRTGGTKGDAVTAAVTASTLMFLNEFSDAIEPDSGFSLQDITFNVLGAGFSVLRNTVPGLKEKVSFKIEIVPNDQIYSRAGKPHYEQQRFMFSFHGAGFDSTRDTPLRYLDLQIGYYASDFLLSDRAAGIEPKRHVFVGAGLNLGEILFGRSRSGFGQGAYKVLDYFQVPYTSVRYDTTGRLGF